MTLRRNRASNTSQGRPRRLAVHVTGFVPAVMLPAILAIGAVQVAVHLKYFLHLTGSSDAAWNITVLALTIVIMAIVVAGTLWVIFELNQNMMPGMAAGRHMARCRGCSRPLGQAPIPPRQRFSLYGTPDRLEQAS
jgi:heme/copper-type cytochrome/quinol oxidase subunit 4